MIVRTLALTAVLGMAACQAAHPEIDRCENYIIKSLKAPSTYKRIKADGLPVPFESPEYYSVQIEFDASNENGVPIRETRSCRFGLIGKSPDIDNYFGEDEPSLQEEADNMLMQALGS